MQCFTLTLFVKGLFESKVEHLLQQIVKSKINEVEMPVKLSTTFSAIAHSETDKTP